MLAFLAPLAPAPRTMKADSTPRDGGRGGVVFDVDGTLVDSTHLHALAWWRALDDADMGIPMARIHPLIGMGSDKLMAELVGEERPELAEAQSRHFRRLKSELRALPGAADLLRAVAARGAAVVLATSARERDIGDLLAVVDADDAIDHVTHSGDAEQSKPSPDIFSVALAGAGLEPARAIVVGDSVWDVAAAERCGMSCVALLSGGNPRCELEEAGAVAVYADPAQLHAELEDSPLAAYLG